MFHAILSQLNNNLLGEYEDNAVENTDDYDLTTIQESMFSRLPVHDSYQRVISTVDSNQITLIAGATGCGKSTVVPLWIAADLQQMRESDIIQNIRNERPIPVKENFQILIIEPRRAAAKSLFQRLQKMIGDENVSKFKFHLFINKNDILS